MRRQLMYLVLAGGLIVGAAACEDPAVTAGEGEQTPAAEETPAPEPTDGAGDDTEAAAPPPGGVIASNEVTDGGTDLGIDITGLQRQSETVTLAWTITVLSTQGDDRWNPAASMGEGVVDWDVSGVVLVDPVNQQRYLVARSGGEDGECACSVNTHFLMEEGDSADFFATYAAPPADVTTINVEFPRFGAFTDVPIS